MSHKIILDCDPGHDDALAIILAQASSKIDLLGITTVAGNQSIDKVTYNARSIASFLKADDLAIYQGASEPLIEPFKAGENIHGTSGLDGTHLPEPTISTKDKHAVQFIIETIMEKPKKSITLVGIGPLTNIALALKIKPEIISRVKEVVIMGGTYGMGTVSAVVETNMSTDPEAAKIVINAGWPITLMPLDVTFQAIADREVFKRLEGINNEVADFVLDLLTFTKDRYQKNRGFQYPPIHDPCTILYLIEPTLFECMNVPIDIELNGGLTRGMTVVDFRKPQKEVSNKKVAVKLNKDRFWDLFFECLDSIIKKGG